MVEMLCQGQKMLQQTHSHPGMMEPMEQIDNRLLKSQHTSIAIGRASWILEFGQSLCRFVNISVNRPRRQSSL